MRASAAKLAMIDLIAAPETLAFADPLAILGDGVISPNKDTRDKERSQ
jgi:hypothetical protein